MQNKLKLFANTTEKPEVSCLAKVVLGPSPPPTHSLHNHHAKGRSTQHAHSTRYQILSPPGNNSWPIRRDHHMAKEALPTTQLAVLAPPHPQPPQKKKEYGPSITGSTVVTCFSFLFPFSLLFFSFFPLSCSPVF